MDGVPIDPVEGAGQESLTVLYAMVHLGGESSVMVCDGVGKRVGKLKERDTLPGQFREYDRLGYRSLELASW